MPSAKRFLLDDKELMDRFPYKVSVHTSQLDVDDLRKLSERFGPVAKHWKLDWRQHLIIGAAGTWFFDVNFEHTQIHFRKKRDATMCKLLL